MAVGTSAGISISRSAFYDGKRGYFLDHFGDLAVHRGYVELQLLGAGLGFVDSVAGLGDIHLIVIFRIKLILLF